MSIVSSLLFLTKTPCACVWKSASNGYSEENEVGLDLAAGVVSGDVHKVKDDVS